MTKNYLFFIGVAEIACWLVLFVLFLIDGIPGVVAALESTNPAPTIWTFVFYLFLYIIFGPALGVLFLSYANHLPVKESDTVVSSQPTKKWDTKSPIIRAVKPIKKWDEKAFHKDDLVLLKQNTKQSDPNGDIFITKGSNGVVKECKETTCTVEFLNGSKKFEINVPNSLLKKID